MAAEAAFSTMLGDMMARLTVTKFTPEQVRELIEGDVYADTVRDLGFNPLDPERK